MFYRCYGKGQGYEAVAKVLPSLEKATQLMESLAALVGLEMTSPFSAL